MSEAIVSPIVRFVDAACPSGVRPLWQFLAEEIVPPDGPKKGDPFDPNSPPWVMEVLRLFADEQWTESWFTGPRQTGKTLLGFEAPLLYHLFELKEDVICLVPEMDKASLIWRKKIEPVIRHTRYKDLLPVTGKGSRGGDFRLITFLHGVSLTFMGAGGADPPSSATARVVVITEANEMRASDTGDQGNPVDAVRECTASFPNPRVYGESIITTEACITWEQITKTGTNSRVMLRCPQCGTYQYPERVRFHGWEEARTPIDAGRMAGYHCIGCEIVWNEEMRAEAIARARVVHGGQAIDKDGTITGDPPQTRCLGIRYNAMCHPFRTMADIAEREWNARSLGTPQAAMAISQYTWAEPYVSRQQEGSIELTAEDFLRKKSQAPKTFGPTVWENDKKRPEYSGPAYTRHLVPDPQIDAAFATVGVDLQDNRCYWTLVAYAIDGTAYDVAWGQEHARVDQAPWNAGDFARMMDRVDVVVRDACAGLPLELCGLDVADGEHLETAMPWLSGRRPLWVPIRGTRRIQVDAPGDVDGLAQYKDGVWHIHSDNLRELIHAAYRRPNGEPGAAHLPSGLKNNAQDMAYLRHLVCERSVVDPKTRKERIVRDSPRYDWQAARRIAEAMARIHIHRMNRPRRRIKVGVVGPSLV